MRIIAGSNRGRRLQTVPGEVVRPTGERAREALFDILTSRGVLMDAVVLDLFCGTGALGLEALSRGAAHATFVDRSTEAIDVTTKNVGACRESSRARIIRTDASKLSKADRAYSLVMLDPPYGSDLIRPTIEALMAGGWLDVGLLLVAELGRIEDPPELEGLHLADLRRYGAAKFAFYETGTALR